MTTTTLENTLVNENERLDFYKHFEDSKIFGLVEVTLFRLADEQVTDYNGGYWEFHYSEKHKVPFFELRSDKPLHLTCAGNYFDDHVDSFEAGLALSCIVFNRLCWHFHSNETKRNLALSGLFQRYFLALRDIASERNCSKFFGFID